MSDSSRSATPTHTPSTTPTRESWVSPARAHRVIDGDTVVVELDTGYNQRLVQTIRVAGVDTAEIYGTRKESAEYQTGIEQKAFVEDWLPSTATDPDVAFPLAVETLRVDKYGGRWVGHIYRGGGWDGHNYVDGEQLADALAAVYPGVANPSRS